MKRTIMLGCRSSISLACGRVRTQPTNLGFRFGERHVPTILSRSIPGPSHSSARPQIIESPPPQARAAAAQRVGGAGAAAAGPGARGPPAALTLRRALLSSSTTPRTGAENHQPHQQPQPQGGKGSSASASAVVQQTLGVHRAGATTSPAHPAPAPPAAAIAAPPVLTLHHEHTLLGPQHTATAVPEAHAHAQEEAPAAAAMIAGGGYQQGFRCPKCANYLAHAADCHQAGIMATAGGGAFFCSVCSIWVSATGRRQQQPQAQAAAAAMAVAGGGGGGGDGGGEGLLWGTVLDYKKVGGSVFFSSFFFLFPLFFGVCASRANCVARMLADTSLNPINKQTPPHRSPPATRPRRPTPRSSPRRSPSPPAAAAAATAATVAPRRGASRTTPSSPSTPREGAGAAAEPAAAVGEAHSP